MKSYFINDNIKGWYWGYFFQGAVILGLSPILLPLMVTAAASNVNLGNYQAGLVVAAFYLGQLPAPIFGTIAEKTHKFSLLYLCGYILIGIGCLGFAFSHMLWLWILWAFLQGLGAGASNTLTAMYIVDYRPQSEWDKGIGWLQTIYGTGQAIGLLLVAMLQNSPIMAMLLASALMIPGFIIGQWQLPTNPDRTAADKSDANLPHHIRQHGLTPVAHLHHLQHIFLLDLKMLKQAFVSRFGLFMLSWFCCMLGMWMIMNLLPLFFKSNYDISSNLSSLYYGIFAVIGIFFYAPSGAWGQRFGSNKILFVGMIMLVVSLLTLALLTHTNSHILKSWLAPLCFSLIPIGWSPLIVAGTSFASECTTIGQGGGLGLYNANTAISSILSAIIAGKIADLFGYATVALIAAIFGLVGVVLFIPLLKNQPE